MHILFIKLLCLEASFAYIIKPLLILLFLAIHYAKEFCLQLFCYWTWLSIAYNTAVNFPDRRYFSCSSCKECLISYVQGVPRKQRFLHFNAFILRNLNYARPCY